MKRFINLFLCTCAVLLAAAVCRAQDRAVLRKGADATFHVDVVLETASQPGGPLLAALYSINADGKRVQKQKISGPLPPQADPKKTVFSFDLAQAPGDDDSFVVTVFELPTADGALSYDLPVTKLLTTGLRTGRGKCAGGIQISLRSPDYTLKDWQSIEKWVNTYSQRPNSIGTVEVVNATTKSKFPVRGARLLTPAAHAAEPGNGLMYLCLEVEPQLPAESFRATINFNGAPTYDLQQPITESGLDPAPAPPLPTMADDNGVPGQRGMERNLDLGVSFNSAVAEVEKPDKTKAIKRTSRGTLDVRLAPWLYIGARKYFDRNQKWYRYFTPVFLDAAVSTGKIDENTLSMNRVIFGTEYEWRYYAFEKNAQTGNTRATPYQTFHRFILRGTHASDRDFKQLEYLATFEYQPVLGSLNHPLYLNWKFDETGRRVAGNFGYEIKPRFGFSLGRTYARRNPAEAVEVSPTARRFYTGLDMTFNLTRYVALSLSDTFFLRGEAHDDRFHNHFKGAVEAPLGRPFGDTVHSMFVSFERGNEPPFATRDVDVVKVGYRIRSEGWFKRIR